jgi:hypothetical protein
MWRAPNLYGGHFQVSQLALTTVNFYKSLASTCARVARVGLRYLHKMFSPI